MIWSWELREQRKKMFEEGELRKLPHTSYLKSQVYVSVLSVLSDLSVLSVPNVLVVLSDLSVLTAKITALQKLTYMKV